MFDVHYLSIIALIALCDLASSTRPARRAVDFSSNAQVPLVITNRCTNTIWPGLATQGGSLPEFASTFTSSNQQEDAQGFVLPPGSTRNLTVKLDWNGRVWGRTNCTFNADGYGRCGTGDCGGGVRCASTNEPATLAEFNLPAYQNNSFYDISLVDGWNLDIAIQVIHPSSGEGRRAINEDQSMPLVNRTNPSCVASPWDLAAQDWDPYGGEKATQGFLGTSAQQPLPFDTAQTMASLQRWCPDDLLLTPDSNNPTGSSSYRPCQSACKRYGNDFLCCTGKFEKDVKCPTNFYSEVAKRVCPDAYSYAYDDRSSTFAVPMGNGFEVVFCPGGRSTQIQKALGNTAAALRPRLTWILISIFSIACWGSFM